MTPHLYRALWIGLMGMTLTFITIRGSSSLPLLATPTVSQNTQRVQHVGPVIIPAFKHYQLSGFPLDHYRVIKNDGGTAKIIPFQIDEQNSNRDFIFDHHLTNDPVIPSDELFNGTDELSFMGTDLGSSEVPTQWNFTKPDFLFRLDARLPSDLNSHQSVFVAIYASPETRPPLSPKKYVNFNLKTGKINTSRYSYRFDPKNHLVIREVRLKTPTGEDKQVIQSSSFYLKSDFKYFLSFEVGHSDIRSRLKAYKTGPIRTIVHVTFAYNFLKLNFEMGMYTEVSFFANSVMLPTIMHNPFEGKKNLNPGSGFYYGFGVPFDAHTLNTQTNMPPYTKDTSWFRRGEQEKVQSLYRLSLGQEDFLMLVMIRPSMGMRMAGTQLRAYIEPGNPLPILQRDWNRPLPLGKSPVNLGVHLELNRLSPGDHSIGFQMMLENQSTPHMERNLQVHNQWRFSSRPVSLSAPPPAPSKGSTTVP